MITTRDVFGTEYSVPADKLQLSVHVYGIAIRGDKVLISPQWDGYDYPGGTMELGETIEETLKREFKEETGFEVEPKQLIGAYSSFFHVVKTVDLDKQGILLFYFVKIVGGELSIAGFDEHEKEYAKEARWVTIDELRKMHHACNIDIADELITKIKGEIK